MYGGGERESTHVNRTLAFLMYTDLAPSFAIIDNRSRWYLPSCSHAISRFPFQSPGTVQALSAQLKTLNALRLPCPYTNYM
jgi:hypothetical protein